MWQNENFWWLDILERVDEMALGSMILKMKPEAENSLRTYLEGLPGVSVESGTPGGELVILVEAEDLKALHVMSQEIEKAEGVIGLYPSYITTEDEED